MLKIKFPAVHSSVIEVYHSDEPGGPVVIEMRSNLSMTLDRLAAVFLALSALVLLVALGPTIMGYWPVMVAAVVHLALVGWCLRLAWRANWARERVVIERDQVLIEHFDMYRQTRSRWPAAWLRVATEDWKLGEKRVVVSCHGRRQVIGQFLPHDERLALADALRKNLAPLSATGS